MHTILYSTDDSNIHNRLRRPRHYPVVLMEQNPFLKVERQKPLITSVPLDILLSLDHSRGASVSPVVEGFGRPLLMLLQAFHSLGFAIKLVINPNAIGGCLYDHLAWLRRQARVQPE